MYVIFSILNRKLNISPLSILSPDKVFWIGPFFHQMIFNEVFYILLSGHCER